MLRLSSKQLAGWIVLWMIQPVFASSNLETLQALARQKHLSSEPYWHRLLHYNRNLLGLYQSEIDDPSFFLSPRGRKDPETELDATLSAFFASPQPSPLGRGRSEAAGEAEPQPAQCRFPARYAWLKEQLRIDPSQLPEQSCPRFEKWKDQMDPESLSIVFASYYMNNPASTYGHTFLRLNAKRHSSGERLLDYVVNFAADLQSDNGALFALKGLAGGYHGRFSTFPYYMKVQEYNNLESRDLWEYDLRVSPADLERLLQHLWEMGNVRSRYFFFNKNCSYYLLPVLEVMDPTLSVRHSFVFTTVPIDTVRAVIWKPGMLEGVTYRPSHATKMIAARQRLSEDEIVLAERAAADPGRITDKDLSRFPRERQAMLLDSAYDLFRYHVGFKRPQPKEVLEKERRLLLFRNRVSLPPSPDLASGEGRDEGKSIVPSPQPSPAEGGRGGAIAPHLGHKTERVDLSYGFSSRSHFEEISFRPALHSQDDPPQGFLPGGQLEMGHLKLRYDDDRKTAYLQELSFVDLLSITPWDRWIHPPSWKIKTGLMTANDLNRDPENSLYYGLNLGSGYAMALGSPHPHPLPSQRGEGRAEPGVRGEPFIMYGMVNMDLELGHAFDHEVRLGGGPSGGVLFNPAPFWRARFQVSHMTYAVGGPSTTKLSLHQSLFLTKNTELRASVDRQNTYKEVLLSWVLFL